MSVVHAAGGRRGSVSVDTMVHRSARTGQATAYVTVGYIPLRSVRRWRRTLAHVGQVVRHDVPAEAKVVLAFTNRDGRPGRQRTIRKGRADG